MQEKRLGLKLLTCALKVTLQGGGGQVGTTLEVYLHLPGVPSSIQTAMPRVETELRWPDGGIGMGRSGGNIIGEDGWARPGCSPINLASGQLTSRSSVSPAA